MKYINNFGRSFQYFQHRSQEIVLGPRIPF
jgi:hypothetical protein